jgi:hypothetical protein
MMEGLKEGTVRDFFLSGSDVVRNDGESIDVQKEGGGGGV